MKKQYINSSNLPPKGGLAFPWLLALTTYVLDWPSWIYGAAATTAVLFFISFWVRIFSEDGVDLVKR